MFKVRKLFEVKTALVMLTLITLLSGCATSPKIQTVQIADNQLTTEQIVAELQKLDQTQQQIESKKGMTGTNVAAALFWLPGLAYTYYDAGEANRLIEQRRAHLTALYNQRMSPDLKPSQQRRG